MNHKLDSFLNYLLIEKGLSANTMDAYGQDLSRYVDFLSQRYVTQPDEVSSVLVLDFLARVEASRPVAAQSCSDLGGTENLSPFLLAEGHASANPTGQIQAPRTTGRLPTTLSPDEVERLLDAPAGDSS
ncbi:MAG: site-specific integrase [Syntrophotaleaceae bacterium]